MFKEIELKNVRIFGDDVYKFPIPRLTVFCGTNSSGKSTILKTFLLLRQSQDIRDGLGNRNGELRFRGPQVDLGNYSSFVHQKDIKKDISITITIEGLMPSYMFSFLYPSHLENTEEPQETKANSDDIVSFESYTLRCSFTFSACFMDPTRKKHKNQRKEVIESENSDHLFQPGVLKSAKCKMTFDGEEPLSWGVRLAKRASYDQLKYEILVSKDYFKKVCRSDELYLDPSEHDDFLVGETKLKGILPSQITVKINPNKTDEDSPEETSPKIEILSLPPHIENAVQNLQWALNDIHYLGPLRTPPKRYYFRDVDINPSWDPTGEFLPHILQRQHKVYNVKPGCTETTEESLSDALGGWLYYLRTGKKVDSKVENELEVFNYKDVLVEFELKSALGDRAYALADSGFGYSQVLPILVQGLLMRPGDSLFIEQPGLHLNPSLQVRLSQFFVAMACAEKQLVIETHSEHIVNAIRVIAAEDESGEISSNCGIVFIDIKDNKPQTYELSIKDDGTVSAWPYNFFGEATTLTGRLLRAQKRFRKQSQKKDE